MLNAETVKLWADAFAPVVREIWPAVLAITLLWLTHRFTAARDAKKLQAEHAEARKRFLREKLEEVVAHVGQHLHESTAYGLAIGAMGIDSAHGHPSSATTNTRTTGADDRAAAIVALYFPSLDTAVHELRAANLVFGTFCQQELAAVGKDAKAWAIESRDFGRRAAEAQRAMFAAQRTFTGEARRLIQTELKLQ